MKIALCLLFLVTIQGTVRAALLNEDSAFGNGTITFDDATGLRWLDLTLTTSISYNDMQTRLGPGGQFDGYRYATSAELSTLFSNAGSSTLLTHLGQTYFSSYYDNLPPWDGWESRSGYGFIGPTTRGYYQVSLSGSLAYGMASSSSAGVETGAYSLTAANPYNGHFLVQASAAVPEPATTGVAAVALFALWRRRRN